MRNMLTKQSKQMFNDCCTCTIAQMMQRCQLKRHWQNQKLKQRAQGAASSKAPLNLACWDSPGLLLTYVSLWGISKADQRSWCHSSGLGNRVKRELFCVDTIGECQLYLCLCRSSLFLSCSLKKIAQRTMVTAAETRMPATEAVTGPQ